MTQRGPEPRPGPEHGGGWHGVEKLHMWLERRDGGRRDHSDIATRVGSIRHSAKGSM
jgi:hypothetical protein